MGRSDFPDCKVRFFPRQSLWSGGGGGGWHKASVSDCLSLAAPIGLSPPLILTLCGPERVLVVSTEPPDDLSCLTTPGVGCPGDGAVARAVDLGGGSKGGYPPLLLRCAAILILPWPAACPACTIPKSRQSSCTAHRLTLEERKGGGGGLGPNSLCTTNGLTRFSRWSQWSLFLTMVTFLCGGWVGGFGTRPRCLIVCRWRRLLASRHCSF